MITKCYLNINEKIFEFPRHSKLVTQNVAIGFTGNQKIATQISECFQKEQNIKIKKPLRSEHDCFKGRENCNSMLSHFLLTTPQRRSDLCIPGNQTVWPHSKFHIHRSTSDLYIPRIGPSVLLHPNRHTDPRNILIAHRYMYIQYPHVKVSGL